MTARALGAATAGATGSSACASESPSTAASSRQGPGRRAATVCGQSSRWRPHERRSPSARSSRHYGRDSVPTSPLLRFSGGTSRFPHTPSTRSWARGWPMSLGVLIVDDQALVRAGFRMILEAEEDMEVVGEAADGQEAVAEARRLRPDVVLMDVRMPDVDGIEATRRLLSDDGTDAKVVMLTTFDMDEYVYDALRAGASGFLLKDVPPEQLVAGIRAVASGDALLAPSVTRRVIEEFVRRPPASVRTPTLPPKLSELTTRELEVLKLIARGLSNSEIAKELFVSETTVKTHVGHVLTKLDVRDRVQAVVLAYESGLVEPGQA